MMSETTRGPFAAVDCKRGGHFTRRTIVTSDKYALVFDKVEQFTTRVGEPHAYRVRVWRRRGQPAIVLVSQINSKDKPWRMSAAVANWVFGALLGLSSDGMRFFESHLNLEQSGSSLTIVTFEHFGKHPARQRFYNPQSTKVDWELICNMTGAYVEL
jgi:hypothetical protein